MLLLCFLHTFPTPVHISAYLLHLLTRTPITHNSVRHSRLHVPTTQPAIYHYPQYRPSLTVTHNAVANRWASSWRTSGARSGNRSTARPQRWAVWQSCHTRDSHITWPVTRSLSFAARVLSRIHVIVSNALATNWVAIRYLVWRHIRCGDAFGVGLWLVATWVSFQT